MRSSVRGRVLDYIRRRGYPVMPMPDGPVGTEAYRREEERRRVLSARRLEEMADALCLPTRYLVRVLVDLEDSGVVDWRTGKIVAGAERAAVQRRRARASTRLG